MLDYKYMRCPVDGIVGELVQPEREGGIVVLGQSQSQIPTHQVEVAGLQIPTDG